VHMGGNSRHYREPPSALSAPAAGLHIVPALYAAIRLQSPFPAGDDQVTL